MRRSSLERHDGADGCEEDAEEDHGLVGEHLDSGESCGRFGERLLLLVGDKHERGEDIDDRRSEDSPPYGDDEPEVLDDERDAAHEREDRERRAHVDGSLVGLLAHADEGEQTRAERQEVDRVGEEHCTRRRSVGYIYIYIYIYILRGRKSAGGGGEEIWEKMGVCVTYGRKWG